jgi:hypothetical protein
LRFFPQVNNLPSLVTPADTDLFVSISTNETPLI